jgi:prepilin-type N-terminal cleavage/methylation domain-containing protein
MRAWWSARASSRSEAGFSLMEVIVAMVIIGGVMAAASLFFINGLGSTGGTSQRQSAVTLADQGLEQAQAVDPAYLLTGRTQSDVAALMASPGASTIVALDQTASGNYDLTAVEGAAQAVPIYTYPIVNGIPYTVTTFIDTCWLKGSTTSGSCTATKATGLTQLFRVSVDVSWRPTSGRSCAGLVAGRCDYVISSLIDPSGDPVFSDTSCTVGVTGVGITGISPKNVLVGNTTNITLTGTGFASGAAVSIASAGGVAGNVISTSATQLVFSLQAGSKAGSYLITVLNPNGCTGTGLVIEDAAPVISNAVVAACGSPVSVSLTGTGFQNDATLTISSGGALSGFAVTSTSATVQVTGTPGTYSLLLTNPDDGGTASKNITLTACSPVISHVSAVRTCTSSGHSGCTAYSTAVTVTGTNLGAAQSVSLVRSGSTTKSSSVVATQTSVVGTFNTDMTGKTYSAYVTVTGGTVSNTLSSVAL